MGGYGGGRVVNGGKRCASTIEKEKSWTRKMKY